MREADMRGYHLKLGCDLSERGSSLRGRELVTDLMVTIYTLTQIKIKWRGEGR